MLNDSQHPRNNKALKIDFTDARTQGGLLVTWTQGDFFTKFPRFKNCCSHKELHKIFKFQGLFDLKSKGQGRQFSNLSEIFR